MENQSHTQPKSNNIVNKIKENLNYIYIVLMIIVNILLGLLTIEDGQIGLRYPSSALGWVLWAFQIIAQTIIGVLILNGFRRQGVKLGHEVIKDTYDKYLEITRKNKSLKPRSLKEYMGKEAAKDGLSKAFILVLVSVFVGSVIIGANLNNILSLIINIILSIGFGIKALLDAENFVITELIVWYQLKTAEVTDQTKEEPAKEKQNESKLQRPKQSKPRPTKSGGVQQKKECSTRPKNSKSGSEC